jgi:hypothetical protein
LNNERRSRHDRRDSRRTMVCRQSERPHLALADDQWSRVDRPQPVLTGCSHSEPEGPLLAGVSPWGRRWTPVAGGNRCSRRQRSAVTGRQVLQLDRLSQCGLPLAPQRPRGRQSSRSP